MELVLVFVLLGFGQYVLWTKNVPELFASWKELRFWQRVIHLETCLGNDEDNDQEID